MKASSRKQRVGLESGFNFAAWSGVAWAFVHKGIEPVAATIRSETGAKRWLKNIGRKSIPVAGQRYVPFQLRGNEWTNIIGFLPPGDLALDPQLLQKLSRNLKTRAIFATYEKVSGLFLYLLYDKGALVELLSWDGSSKPRTLRTPPSDPLGTPLGFSFFSKFGRLHRGELNGSRIVPFFDNFLRSQGAFLVLEPGSYSNGEFSFSTQRLDPREILRADLVALLDEEETAAQEQAAKQVRQIAAAVDACNKAFFFGYKARDEYKDVRSWRPTKADAALHRQQHQRLARRVKNLLKSADAADERWLRSAALGGNEALVNIFVELNLFSEKTRRAVATQAREREQYSIAEILSPTPLSVSRLEDVDPRYV